MSIFLQIGLGLIPAWLGFVIVMCIRKRFSRMTILSSVLSAAFIAVLIVGGLPDKKPVTKSVSVSKEELLDIAYLMMEQESWDFVDQLVDEYSASYGYDNECTLVYARMAAVKGDSEVARALYQKMDKCGALTTDSMRQELALAMQACTYDANNRVMLDYIASIGKQPADYNLNVTVDPQVVTNMIDGVKSVVSQRSQAGSIGADLKEIADVVAETEQLYGDYLAEDTENTYHGEASVKEKAVTLVEKFETAGNHPKAFSVYPIRMARLKAFVLSEQYEKIPAHFDEYVTYDELMIASELLMNGYITPEDFRSGWGYVNPVAVQAICKQMEDNIRRAPLSDQEREVLLSRVESLRVSTGGEVIYILENRLNRSLYSLTGDVDKSKIYLQKSKINRYIGDVEKANENMLMAFDTAANSKDDNYSHPMHELSGIMRGDRSSIKNIANYVDQVIHNSLTIRPSTDIFIERVETVPGEPVNKDETEEKQGFAEYMEQQVNFYGVAVNISSIDYSQFPNITAKVQIASEFVKDQNNPEASVTVTDCWQNISDFNLEKINYSKTNILLLCDNSGSMSGSISQLQDAVQSFVDSSSSDEHISLVIFDSGILEETTFVNNKSQLQSTIDGMRSRGGTNIYGSLQYAIDKFSYDPDANNIIIVMTDGQDSRHSYEDMEREIGLDAANKGITIYTLGLGGVEEGYLADIAAVGGGDFVYASDSAKLEGLYDIIHGQTKNQYRLTYVAKDNFTIENRTLNLQLKQNSLFDEKKYSLSDGGVSEETLVEISKNIHLYGFDTRIIYKSNNNTTVHLKGDGFTADEAIHLVLDGSVDYPLNATFVDAQTYSVVIPYGVAVDTYNLRVTIGEDSAVLPEELYVVEKDRKSITFGAYTFTANKIVTESSHATLLSGFVDMNGWLQFKGDIRLEGDVKNGSSITIRDYSGAYIPFDPETARGLSKYLANRGFDFDVGGLDGTVIYNDLDHINNVKDYRVSTKSGSVAKAMNLFSFYGGSQLYPDRLEYELSGLGTMMPLQDAVIKTISKKDDLLKLDLTADLKVNRSGLFTHIDFEYEDERGLDVRNFGKAKLFSQYVGIDTAKVKLDTMDNEYSVTFLAAFDFLDDSAFGVTLGWKDCKFDELLLHADFDVPVQAGPVPLTFSDFAGGLKDMSSEAGFSKERLLNSTLSLQTKLSCAKLSSWFPKLNKYFGDISLLSTDDLELQLSVGRGYFSIKSDLLFLEEIKLANVEAELGNFPYTNTMLGLEDVDVEGFRFYRKQGIMYDKLKGLEVDLSVNSEFSAHSRFFGFKGGATGKLLLEWWLFDKKFDVSGDAIIGIYTDHADHKQFTIGFKNTDGKKTTGRMVFIDDSGLDTKKL